MITMRWLGKIHVDGSQVARRGQCCCARLPNVNPHPRSRRLLEWTGHIVSQGLFAAREILFSRLRFEICDVTM